jgi:hypothetical protein
LVHLDLSTCQKLKQLPKSMGDLRSLQYLNLEDTLWGKSSGKIYGQADIFQFLKGIENLKVLEPSTSQGKSR